MSKLNILLKGERRRFTFDLTKQSEIIAGELLVIDDLAISLIPATDEITIEDPVINDDANKVQFWLDATNAVTSDTYICKCVVFTSTGSKIIDTGDLHVKDYV